MGCDDSNRASVERGFADEKMSFRMEAGNWRLGGNGKVGIIR